MDGVNPDVLLPSIKEVGGQFQERELIGRRPLEYQRNGGREYLYSGLELASKGEARGSWHDFQVATPGGMEVTLLMRTSPKHGAMDGLAVWVADDGSEIRWAKADGVSKLDPSARTPNLSAELAETVAHQIGHSSMSIDQPEADWQQAALRRLSASEAVLHRQAKEGACTAEYGVIGYKPKKLAWEVRMARVGSMRSARNLTGDSGGNEGFFTNELNREYAEEWDAGDTQRSFVGIDQGGRRFRTYLASSDLPYLIVSYTDAVKPVSETPEGGRKYQRPGQELVKLLAEGTSVEEVMSQAQEMGLLDGSDDASLLVVRLPQKPVVNLVQ